MENRQTVQFALSCIEGLNHPSNQPVSPKDLSRRQGVPLPECLTILRRLGNAGIVEFRGEGRVRLSRPVDELTALEILQALWVPEETQPAFRMLVGSSRGLQLRKTLEFVRREQAKETNSSVNNVTKNS